MGENLCQAPTATRAMVAWMGSVGHKASILADYHNYVGIAYYNGYWAVLFTQNKYVG